MNNFHFGYSHNAHNKKITGDISLGWQSKQGTVDDLASHIKKGLPVCHSVFTGQKRADAHFNFADICLVDIDNSAILKGEDGKPVKGDDGKAIKVYKEELTIPQMMEHEFIKSHCFYSYTSASHKPDHHKYRLAFRLPNRITDPKLFKAVLLELKSRIPSIDKAATSITNIYFGNDEAINLIVNPDASPIPQEFIDKASATQAALEAEKQALKANREAWKANYADCDNDRLEREIYRALEYISPRIEGGGTYDTSIRVCWALASHFGESKAIAIMESHSPSHGKWDVAKVVSQYHKYPDVGIGSIFHFAKCNGYKRLEPTTEEKKAWWAAQPKSALSGKKYLDNKHEDAAAARLEANKIKADLILDRLPTFAELQEILKSNRDVFLTGAKGLGKSELGGEFVKNAESALLPVPLESLARNNAERFNIDYRTDCDRVNGQLIGGAGFVSKLSFCTEAIHGLKSHINSGLERGAVVFNDELDLQLNSLATSSTHAQNGKRRVNDSLYWEMQTRAKQTLSVSADLTNYEAELWERKTGRKPCIIRVNTPKKNYEVRLFEDNRGIILHKIPQAIRAGERLIICCSRKSEAKFLAYLFKDYGAIAIHRDNANEPMFDGFFDNPNQWLRDNKPQILIVSPVLRSGFSITGDFFDKVFCLFHSDSINASTALQLSERYRPPVPRYFFAAQSSGKYRHITPESILKTRIGRAKAAGSNEISFVDENDSYFHYKAADNWSKANFRADIIARLKDEVNCGDLKIEPNKLDRADAAIYAGELENFKLYEQEKLRNARNLSKAEYESMKDRRDLLEADLLAIEKFRLSNWSDTSPESVTLEQIERDDKGKKRKALERLEKQAYPELAIKQDKHSLEAQQTWGYGVAHQDVSHTALTQKALEQIGLHEFLDFVLSGNSWHIVEEDGAVSGTTEAIAFAQKLRDLRNSKQSHIDKNGKEYFTRIDKLAELGIHLSCGYDASLASYIGAMLSWLGLARSAKQETINKKRVRVYRLHEQDLALTRAELSRRAARFMGEGLELVPSHPFVERISSLHTPFYTVPIKRCVQVENPQKTQTGGGGFGAKIIKKVETFVSEVVQTIESYLTPEEIAAGYF